MEKEDPRLARSKGRMRCQFCREWIPRDVVYVQATGGDFRGICVPCWDGELLGPVELVRNAAECGYHDVA